MLTIVQDGQVLLELEASAGLGSAGRDDAAAIIDTAAAGAVAKFGADITSLVSRHTAATDAAATATRRIAELVRERAGARSRLFGVALSSRLAEIYTAVTEAREGKADAEGEAAAAVAALEELRGRVERECADVIRTAVKAKAPAVQSTRDDAASRLGEAVADLLSRYTRAVAALDELRLANPETAAREALIATYPALFGYEGQLLFPSTKSDDMSQTIVDSGEWLETEAERMEGTTVARNWGGLR